MSGWAKGFATIALVGAGFWLVSAIVAITGAVRANGLGGADLGSASGQIAVNAAFSVATIFLAVMVLRAAGNHARAPLKLLAIVVIVGGLIGMASALASLVNLLGSAAQTVGVYAPMFYQQLGQSAFFSLCTIMLAIMVLIVPTGVRDGS